MNAQQRTMDKGAARLMRNAAPYTVHLKDEICTPPLDLHPNADAIDCRESCLQKADIKCCINTSSHGGICSNTCNHSHNGVCNDGEKEQNIRTANGEVIALIAMSVTEIPTSRAPADHH